MNEKQELKDRLQKALDMNDKKPADLSKALNIPKSALSQYLSGRSKNMTSERMYAICKYLNVAEAWMMGFDVPMERPLEQKESDAITDITKRFQEDEEFRKLVSKISNLNPEQYENVKRTVDLFSGS